MSEREPRSGTKWPGRGTPQITRLAHAESRRGDPRDEGGAPSGRPASEAPFLNVATK